MENHDIELLWMFTLRAGMYTGKENSDTISSFLHGYEIGRNNECKFIDKFIDSIQQEYNISPKATGWIGQIEMAAEKECSDWLTIFKAQSIKLLAHSMNYSVRENLLGSLKSRIIGKAGGIHHHFRKDWVSDWFGIVHIDQNWFRSIWTYKEIELIKNIESELLCFGKIRLLKDSIVPSENLEQLCSELYDSIKDS